RAARPSLDDLLGPLLVLGEHLLHEVLVHEGTLLEATWHPSAPLALLAALATTDDEPVTGLPPAGPAFRLTPWRHRVAATRALALTTTERVVDRVHRDTAHRRTPPLPAGAPGLAQGDVALLGVPDLADRGTATDVDHPDLTGRHPQRR